jgi:MinD superfamily P-loop ATPase
MKTKPKGKTMHTMALFNHKGGVGKTTLTINMADAMVDLGLREVDPIVWTKNRASLDGGAG